MTAVDKVVFDGGGAFIHETRREVDLYLADARTRRSGVLRLYAKAAIAVGLSVGSWTFLLVARPGPAFVAACPAGLAVGAILTALCVQHDANHGAFFRRKRWNYLRSSICEAGGRARCGVMFAQGRSTRRHGMSASSSSW